MLNSVFLTRDFGASLLILIRLKSLSVLLHWSIKIGIFFVLFSICYFKFGTIFFPWHTSWSASLYLMCFLSEKWFSIYLLKVSDEAPKNLRQLCLWQISAPEKLIKFLHFAQCTSKISQFYTKDIPRLWLYGEGSS